MNSKYRLTKYGCVPAYQSKKSGIWFKRNDHHVFTTHVVVRTSDNQILNDYICCSWCGKVKK